MLEIIKKYIDKKKLEKELISLKKENNYLKTKNGSLKGKIEQYKKSKNEVKEEYDILFNKYEELKDVCSFMNRISERVEKNNNDLQEAYNELVG